MNLPKPVSYPAAVTGSCDVRQSVYNEDPEKKDFHLTTLLTGCVNPQDMIYHQN